MKISRHIFSMIMVSALPLAGCGVKSDVENITAPTYSAEAEALYMKRFKARGKSQATALSAYDTLGPVSGTQVFKKLPTAQTQSVSQHAIKEDYIKSLDQPVSDFITEWKGSEKEKILVRHLLDMRVGLLPQGQALEPEHILNRAYMHPHYDEVIIHEHPLTHEPGTRYEYANSTAELVVPLIERATGVQYKDWVGEWDGQRLLPEGFVAQVKQATRQSPHTGMGGYVAGPYVEKRGPLNPEIKLGPTLHSEPYLASDLFLFDGNSYQTAYIIPSADLVILRTGNWVPEGKIWDNSQLPNIILKGIEFEAGKTPEVQQ